MRHLLCAFVLTASCTPTLGDPAAPGGDGDPAATAPVVLDARFVPLVASAFRDYKPWGRVDDELRWAPFLCRLPLPGRARMSAADDGGHARKLYSVFAKQRDRYPLVQEGTPMSTPAGQVLVKESYYPEPVDKTPPPEGSDPSAPIEADHFDPYARDGDRLYRAARFAGAYVLLKLSPETAGTDAGWVYGTVTSEGEVTSAGLVASCMQCHVDAHHERVFGLPAAHATP